MNASSDFASLREVFSRTLLVENKLGQLDALAGDLWLSGSVYPSATLQMLGHTMPVILMHCIRGMVSGRTIEHVKITIEECYKAL